MRTTKEQRQKARLGSIKHWKEDYPKHIDWEAGKFEAGWYPSGKLCALCRLHKTLEDCGNCDLVDVVNNAGHRYGCVESSQYGKAGIAVRRQDKPAFMRARRNIIRRIQRAYDKEAGK